MPEFEFEIDEILDVTGLRCPLPLLKTKKKLAEMASEGILQVMATDPGSVRDFGAYMDHSNHQMLASTERQGVFIYTIRRGSG